MFDILENECYSNIYLANVNDRTILSFIGLFAPVFYFLLNRYLLFYLFALVLSDKSNI